MTGGRAFVCPRRVDRPALRFIAFHHAGGSALAYYPLARLLPSDWDVLLYDLPGHGGRRAEPLRADMDQVLSAAVRDVAPYTDAPYVLFGHSMGSIIASEVARRLSAALRPPIWVGVSGRMAPSALGLGRPPLSRLDDASLFATLLRLGGTPARLSAEPELKKLFLRLVRADFRAVESYVPDPRRRPLPCPLSVFGGTADPWTPVASLAGWRGETAAGFHQRLFPGGHFYFMDETFAALAAEITRQATPAVPARTASQGLPLGLG